MSRRIPLPVDAVLPSILEASKQSLNVVIEAPPGAGKTTRVPPALLDQVAGEIVVLEPRRIAARLAARRVAWEMGEELGKTVGYQVRFEEVSGPRTRLRFVTEGVLIRRLLSDPELEGVSAIVLDEFHERHMETDLSLALLKHLQQKRRDLRIFVMSATLDTAGISTFLNCPSIRSEGKLFEVEVEHLPYSPEPLERQVARAVEMLAERDAGDILTFLPGVAEIRRAARECEPMARRMGLLVLPLHGALSVEEQDRAVSPAGQRKLILATNVAESSVTVEGVTAVIDSGLVRRAVYSHWSGLPTLHVGRTSKASARQRAGRAGRTRPGRALRLYSEQDYSQRPEHETPEILRADLSQLCLNLRALGFGDVSRLRWLDTPPSEAVAHAESLLDRLGATGKMAQRLAQYPLPPRLSRLLAEAVQRGVGEDGCIVAALLGSGTQAKQSDLLTAVESPLDRATQQHLQQLRRVARVQRQTRRNEDALLMSVLTAFPDRVARRRSGSQVQLSNGLSAEIAGEAPRYEFMVAIDAEERRDKPLPIIRMVSRIEPEWLIDLFPDRVREEMRMTWNRESERVDATSVLLYDELLIQESDGAAPDAEAAADLLAEKALAAGIERFVDGEELNLLKSRAEFAGLEFPELGAALRNLCSGLRSFAELKRAGSGMISLLEQQIGTRRLNSLAPAKISLPNGRQTKVHYEGGKPPWIASRLQDFLGMRETPTIGPNRTPVVVQLLAPNHRPVQTTSDLGGFWERLYPQVRRELMRRYPKHAWPERP